jgi:hypothetical protein
MLLISAEGGDPRKPPYVWVALGVLDSVSQTRGVWVSSE